MSHTLVLNGDAKPLSLLPLSTIHWQDAVKCVYLDRNITVLEWYDDWIVRSPSWETKVPAVIMIDFYVKRSKMAKPSRYNVALRDGFRCQYCGDDIAINSCTLDHVFPVSRGGHTDWANLVTSCSRCNTHKGSKLIKPQRKPHEPSIHELSEIRRRFPFDLKHESWQSYI